MQKGEDIGVTPDSVSVINLSVYPPKVIGSLKMPAAMIGSPNAVAIGAGEQFAIVTAAQKSIPPIPLKPVPNDQVSVIDLANPARPRLLQTVRAGANAAGLSINKAGTLVLVAARERRRHLCLHPEEQAAAHPRGASIWTRVPSRPMWCSRPTGARPMSRPGAVPRSWNCRWMARAVARTRRDIATGLNPYGAVITPDGNWLISTNVGGALMGTDRTGTLTMNRSQNARAWRCPCRSAAHPSM